MFEWEKSFLCEIISKFSPFVFFADKCLWRMYEATEDQNASTRATSNSNKGTMGQSNYYSLSVEISQI